MNNDEFRLMSARHLPVRMTAEEVACLLRCTSDDVHVLTRCGLLKPLGRPAPNSKKFYRTKELLELADDPVWLNKMTNAIYKRWREKNGTRVNVGTPFRHQDPLAA